METPELIALAKSTFDKCITTLQEKNHDYSKGKDALRNFKLVESFGLTDSQTGIMVRLTDKMARISNLLNTEPKVSEKVEDTIDDAINYLLLLKACRAEKNV